MNDWKAIYVLIIILGVAILCHSASLFCTSDEIHKLKERIEKLEAK